MVTVLCSTTDAMREIIAVEARDAFDVDVGFRQFVIRVRV